MESGLPRRADWIDKSIESVRQPWMDFAPFVNATREELMLGYLAWRMMRRAMLLASIASIHISACPLSLALSKDQVPVASVGEINASGNSTGTVIADTAADLILTIIADMSQAEPGEEIGSIRIAVPTGFSSRENCVTSVTVRGEDVPGFESVVDMNRITVLLPTLIILTTKVAIGFTVDTPAAPGSGAFIVSLLDISQNPVLLSIEAGNADGRMNNDSLTVKVVAAVKPQPPLDLRVRPDPSGENDLIVSWTESADPLVNGYLIYRSDKADEPVADITSREETSYTDRGLEPGKECSYNIRSYKTPVLRSDASNTASAIVPEDTKDPEPPIVQPEVEATQKGIEINWEASPSLDVVKYVVYRGSAMDSLEPIGEVDADTSGYVDQDPPMAGSYLYVVGAVDDAGRGTRSSATQLRLAIASAKATRIATWGSIKAK